MSVPAGFKGLRFPCECVSSRAGGYSDPWAEITKNKLLPNGTKEEILNVLAQGPKTITQIAEALGLSGPSIHTHVSDMLRSELLREAVESDKVHPAERYYEPNFPVFKAEECAEFRKLCEEMSTQLVALFEKYQEKVARAFLNTSLPQEGWKLSDITQCLFANMHRGARTQLEQRGLLSAREKHKNGAAWIFWAEEPETKKNNGEPLVVTETEQISKFERRSTMAKYGKKAAEKVEKAMHERKKGTLKSGGSGKKVTSKKQAIAIGLSQARKAGAKVPRKKSSSKKR
jgi:DNA-binding transcriptional ArsR family regulator